MIAPENLIRLDRWCRYGVAAFDGFEWCLARAGGIGFVGRSSGEHEEV